MRILVFFIFLFSMSCAMDKVNDTDVPIDYSQLVGHWNIESAMRNGKKTNTLDDAYIAFSKTNELATNIFGQELEQELIWNDSIGLVADSSMTYKLVSLNQDTLNLSFRLQRHHFDILFLKGESE